MRRFASLAVPGLLLLVACTDAAAPNARASRTGATPAVDVVNDDTDDDLDDDTDDPEHLFSNSDVRFSFVVVGCNRVDKADTAAERPSTANTNELNRVYGEVAQLQPRPRFLFFAGDMVYGYASNFAGTTVPDTVTLANQLTGWLQLWDGNAISTTGIELVPVPGNHEVQNAKKVAYAAGERTWLRTMSGRLVHAGNGPAAGGADNLATDQSSLTYSFDYGRTHFVLVDTDPVGKDGSTPVNWVTQDLSAARANHAKHIFVITHKPAYAYPVSLYSPPLAAEDGLGGTYPLERDALWGALVDAHAEAMFSAHNHLYYRTRGPSGATWQVIDGNGGTPIEPLYDRASQSYFGYSVVTVHRNGHVTLTTYAHQIPVEGYRAPSGAYPTFVRDEADITYPRHGE
jgi:hypothetical protein